jgi:hypothetical protein
VKAKQGTKPKKNKVTTVRVNDEIMTMLKKKGWSAQRLIDWAIAQKVTVSYEIKGEE